MCFRLKSSDTPALPSNIVAMNEKDRLMKDLRIDSATTVSDMVKRDYRTASVFKKYDIEFCCGGKWPLETVSMIDHDHVAIAIIIPT